MSTSQPRHGVHVERDTMIPMGDGVRLATDIYLPCHGDGRLLEEKVPALLVRTSYDKTSSEWDDVIPYYVRRGYAFVVQDLRSRFRSEGDGSYFHTANPWEGDDGYDTVEWLAARDWCSGKIGTLGSSHRAITQTQLALRKPPHLAAMWVEAGPTNIYRHEAREGGAASLQMFAAAHLHALDCHEVGDDPVKARAILDAMRNMRAWLQKLPLEPGETALSVAPSLERTALDYYYRGDYDEWWDRECCNQEPYFDEHADVPMTVACGWYDNFVGATCNYYIEMSRRNASPTRLILGPWCHGGTRTSHSWHGDVDTGQPSVWSNAVYNPERLKFFDEHLKGMARAEESSPVRIFVMGTGDGTRTRRGNLNHGGYWRNEAEWPLARARLQTWYLHEDGSLDESAPDDASSSLTLHVRSAESGPHGRRSARGHVRDHSSGRGRADARRGATPHGPVDARTQQPPRGDRGWWFSPEGGTTVDRRPGAVPTAERPVRRAGIRDRAIGGRHRDYRCRDGEAVGVVDRRGHRLHGQAHRCLPGEWGIPGGLSPQSGRYDPTRSISQFVDQA